MKEENRQRVERAFGVSVRSDIVYVTHDGLELRADFYAPSGPGPFPVVVAAPGGGWFVCDRSATRQWAQHLAADGFATFAIEYRVAGKGPVYPGCIRDVLAAIRYVRRHAAELGIDPNRVALLGSSAGAHVASLAALAGGSATFATPGGEDGDVDTSVKAFAGVYGVYDLFAHWQHEIADFAESSGRRSEGLLGVPPFADRQLYFDASPISHVRYAANKLPMFIAYGTADDVVEAETQSEQFARALKQSGFAVTRCPVHGAGHFWFSEEPIDEPGSYSSFLAPRLLRFLRRRLR